MGQDPRDNFMKAFVIFPVICVFVLTLTLLTACQQDKWRNFLWTTLVTAVFGGLATWLSIEMFEFLYFSNFVGVLVCIPCLTYLAHRLLPANSNNKLVWLRIFGLGLISTALTITTAGFLFLAAAIQNPMDPPMRKQQTETRHD